MDIFDEIDTILMREVPDRVNWPKVVFQPLLRWRGLVPKLEPLEVSPFGVHVDRERSHGDLAESQNLLD